MRISMVTTKKAASEPVMMPIEGRHTFGAPTSILSSLSLGRTSENFQKPFGISQAGNRKKIGLVKDRPANARSRSSQHISRAASSQRGRNLGMETT
ncbi:hypothetical protein LB534_18010 [Mesorhizobium sp. CA18]|uniref:hypothetical protein n=1 Tax=unclassified Mesorhizobium TaxID=325217 RepID=UPI001CCA7C8A|nr:MULTISPECIES: hypothetical protein [unclassified Mesorhizobium]MBZ9734884.1 hypothetical protein [Mesorhizobium sp. CA9]MBZ9827183.1 hypothetical protein [Mesorhizobium sp. CA18]MBZ9832627.1 hypothetical protein [Mesorhizobium sp. CA2]MBZ9838627.1 hypothetical protein [Mesorhizobium sp. CA3]MBZ9879235.1 hypothetical protein [Mesorhizobium sp. Ca11]